MKRLTLLLLLSTSLGASVVAIPLGGAGANVSDPTFAGYAATLTSSQPTKVAATFNVPRSKCLNTTGLDGYDTMDVGLGSASGSANVDLTITCSASTATPTYTVSTDAGGTVGPSKTVAPGDVLTFKATPGAGTTSYSLSGARARTLSWSGPLLTATQVSVGMTAQSGPFPKFQPEEFSHVKINGATLGSTGPVADDEYQSTTLEVQASALSANGKGFDLTYISQG
jgi:hypothetical protein